MSAKMTKTDRLFMVFVVVYVLATITNGLSHAAQGHGWRAFGFGIITGVAVTLIVWAFKEESH